MKQVDINIYRPVTSFDDATPDMLVRQLQELGVSGHWLYHQADQRTRASILASSDLETYLRNKGIPASSVDFDLLIGRLTADLPPTVSHSLDVPTFPYNWHRIGWKPLHYFTVATDNPTIRNERAAAQLLVQDFLGMEAGCVAPEWPRQDYKAEVGVIKTGETYVANYIDMVLENMPQVLPMVTTLGPIAVKNGMPALQPPAV